MKIEELTKDDLEEAAVFLGRETEAETATPVSAPGLAERLRWFLFENPAGLEDVPRGWLARSNREIVGIKLCTPQRFRYRDTIHLVLQGGGWYVAAEHRGVGMSLFGRFLALGERHALMSTTLNEQSGRIYDRFGAYPIPNTDGELIGILHWRPVVAEWLLRQTRRPSVARALSSAASILPGSLRRRGPRGSLEPVTDPERVASLLAHTPDEHASQLTALRDVGFLRWRYFARSDPTLSLFLYRTGDEGGESPCFVAVKQTERGAGGSIRSLTVLDVWGDLPGERIAGLARELAARYAQQADVIVFRGQSERRARVLRRAGFVPRSFGRSIAGCIDTAGRLPTRDWYLVPADGDTGL